MKWITTKVIPLDACNYPGMQMVPVMENAPYHHVRGIPSLKIFSKKSTVNLMKEYIIDYVLLPLTNEQITLLPDQYNLTINNGHLQITFNGEKLQKRITKSSTLETSSAEELKVPTVVLLKHHNTKSLRCKM